VDCPASDWAVWDAEPDTGVCPLCGEPAEDHDKGGDPLALLFAGDA
jgi:hypothetical protein